MVSILLCLNQKALFIWFLLSYAILCISVTLCVVPGMGNTSPRDMDSLLPLMNMVIYSIDKVKKLRLNREVSDVYLNAIFFHPLIGVVSLFMFVLIFRANRKLTKIVPGWRRIFWNRLTLSARRLPRPAGRRRRGQRRRGLWMRRTPRDNAVLRSVRQPLINEKK